MILKSMTLRNFKAIGDDPVTIEFKPITLLFGPNSAGKSTIIQALHYAREVFVNGNLNPDTTESGGENVNLGGFQRLVHHRDRKRGISIRFDFSIDGQELPLFRTRQETDHLESAFPECFGRVNALTGGHIELEVTCIPQANWHVVQTLEVGFVETRFALIENLLFRMLFSDEVVPESLWEFSKLSCDLDHPMFTTDNFNALRRLVEPILSPKQLKPDHLARSSFFQ